MHALPLAQLRCGEIAEVAQVAGSAEQVRRLQELGFCAGARLEMIRGGSPCIVRIGNSTLCIRDDELLRVIVTPRKIA